MPSVTIDAGVLAAPREDESKEDAERYVETLLDWSAVLDDNWLSVYMSEKAPESLCLDGLYPIYDHLKRLFKAKGILIADENTVVQVVERLLRSTPSFETYFAVRNVEHDELLTDPDISALCPGTNLQSDLERCVILTAVLRQCCLVPILDHFLILRRAPGKSIRVQAQIMVEHERVDLDAVPVPPEPFVGDVLVCEDFSGLVDCLDAVAAMLGAANDLEAAASIRIAIHQDRLARGTELGWTASSGFRIGQKFLTVLRGLHPTQLLVEKVLREIVVTLERPATPGAHWLRTGGGGDNPQRTRKIDNAKAWRRDIDKDHHLHYWVRADSSVEIASVSYPHDDFTIPE